MAISSEKHEGAVDFLPENQHKIFLYFDSITLGLRSQACPKYLKQYLKKELSDEVDFLHLDKHERLLQIDSMIFMGWSSISKIPKITSL